ncbi:MAG TPA: sulfotransferase domain-containing protein [Pseudomonadales bacterium]|jgi:aryl sulfotransferase|nr:sulfotransferase domain-containing protein [Pseudomonadales bacterium]
MRVYRNAVMDNARWAGFEPRPDDIFVCTPSKCGTTWMQTIVANLLWPEGDIPGTVVNGISPWIEAKFMPAEAMHAMLRAQTHRRAMKSHSPADAIPWFPQAKYITVGRDGRDAFMSWCNHVQRMKMIDMLNAQAAKEGVRPILKFDGDYHSFFRAWLEEENNFFEVIGSFWARRAEPNLLFVHYNDLKADLGGEMRRVAEFLDIQIPESKWAAVIDRCTFESMRRVEGDADPMQMAFEGGIKGFIFKGTNGRWRDVLTDDEVAAYRKRVAETLPDDAAQWIEFGRSALK